MRCNFPIDNSSCQIGDKVVHLTNFPNQSRRKTFLLTTPLVKSAIKVSKLRCLFDESIESTSIHIGPVTNLVDSIGRGCTKANYLLKKRLCFLSKLEGNRLPMFARKAKTNRLKVIKRLFI